MTTAAIISDTHGLLRDEVKEYLKGVDVIIHAGDINTQKIVEELRNEAPLFIVRGNNDKEWAKDLPLKQEFTIEQVRFFLVHNKKDIPKDLADIDVIIYGHSHKYNEEQIDGKLMLNPGSCGKRRFDLEISLALMKIEGSNYTIEKIVLKLPLINQ